MAEKNLGGGGGEGCRHITRSFQTYVSKVVQIIKSTCTVFLDNFRNISINSSIQVSVCRGNYDGCVKHKRNDPVCVPWDSQGNERNTVSIAIAFFLDFLIRNEGITFEESKTKTV